MRSRCPIASFAFSFGVPVLCFLGAQFCTPATSSAQPIGLSHPTAQPPSQLTRESIGAFIAQLDDDDFSTRRIAFETLRTQSDLVADYLFETAEHGTLEQRCEAKKLIQHARRDWKQVIEDQSVSQKVEFMAESSIPQQLTAIRQLAVQQTDAAQSALLKICRLESEVPSLVAARCLLQQIDTARLDLKSNNSQTLAIGNSLSASNRIGSRWVKLALSTDSESTIWNELARESFDHIEQNPNIHPVERDAYLGLVQWHLGRYYESRENRTLQIPGRPFSIDIRELESRYVDAVEQRMVTATFMWLARYQRFEAIEHYYHSNEEAINRDPISLFAMANAFNKVGGHDQAEHYLQLAFKPLGTSAKHHLELGVALHSLGMPVQGAHVLEKGISHATPDSTLLFQCRLVDAYYRQRERDFSGAAKQLWAIHDRVKDDKTLKSRIRKCGVTCDQIVAKAKFNESITCTDPQQQLKLLLDAVELDPHNSDILIGLYELTGNTRLHAMDNRSSLVIEIDDLIRLSLNEMDSEATQLQLQLPHCEHARSQKSIRSRIATLANRTAWVRVKTDRELPKSLLNARRACELQPQNAAFLDTLAHCEFSNKFFDDAIQTQRKAILLDAHHPGFKRTLNQFERALQQRWVASLPVVIMR